LKAHANGTSRPTATKDIRLNLMTDESKDNIDVKLNKRRVLQLVTSVG
jgi:hypothetical protein